MDRLAYSVTEVARMLGISRAHAYDLVKEGVIPSLKLGSRIVVPVRQLRVLFEDPGVLRSHTS